MPYLTIENFKYGLDTRRSELTSQAGVLAVCKNGHVNQGGEIDKRKAFINAGNLGILDGNDDVGTFGIEPISSSIVTFGSALPHGTGPTLSQPVLVSNMPAGFTYQQLQHPYVTDGGTYDRTKYRMTKLVSSCTFEGNTFAVATFADSNTFVYYNGSIVRESSDGKIYGTAISGLLSLDIMNQMTRAFTAKSWALSTNNYSGVQVYTAVHNPIRNETSGFLYNPGSLGYTLGFTLSNGSSVMGAVKAGGTATVAGTVSTATFVVGSSGDGAGSTYAFTASLVLGNVNVSRLNIFGSIDTIAWAVSNINTAGLIVTAINNRTADTGFSASNGGTATVTVSFPNPTGLGIFSSFTPNNLLVNIFTPNTTVSRAFSAANSGGTYGQVDELMIGSTWVTGDTWRVDVTPASGAADAFVVGRGDFGGLPYGQCFPVGGGSGSGGPGGRIFLACGTQFNYSAIDDPTGWEDSDVGASSISYVNNFQGEDTVSGFALYQGRLAVFGLYSIQIWVPNANPTAFQISQTLTNIGTDAPLSVVGFGELDVFFRAQSGIRSLRVRDSSLNAFVTDVGSPIDDVLGDHSTSDRRASCAVLEPTDHRYWFFENDTIYVLSYFPTLKISAWSTYTPTYEVSSIITPVGGGNYNGSGQTSYNVIADAVYIWTKGANDISLTVGGTTYTSTATFIVTSNQTITGKGTANALITASLSQKLQTAFTPEKFIIYNGIVHVRATDGNVYAYGGSNGTTYDYAICTIETPWLDAKKAATDKASRSIDEIATAPWNFYATMDYRTGVSALKLVKPNDSISSPDQGVIPYTSQGTHIKLQAKSLGNAAQTLSALIWHYADNGEKK